MASVLISFENDNNGFLIGSGHRLKEKVTNKIKTMVTINAIFRYLFLKRNIDQIIMVVKILPIAARDAENIVPNAPQTEENPQNPFFNPLLFLIKNIIKKGKKRPTKKPNSFLSTERKIFFEV
jgi:hypothetical protein